MRAVPFFVAALGLLFGARRARAEPEWNVAAQTSLCGLGDRDHVWQKTQFCGAVRGDLLFGRDRNADFALGPYATLGTAKFSDAFAGVERLRLANEGSIRTSISMFFDKLRDSTPK